MFNAFVGTPFQTFASSKAMKFSLRDGDTEAWLGLSAGNGPNFGFNKQILPDRPAEAWCKDPERSVYIRRPDAEESRLFKEAMAARPHGFEVYLSMDGDLDICVRPHVHAHLATHALLHHRGQDKTNLAVSYRLLGESLRRRVDGISTSVSGTSKRNVAAADSAAACNVLNTSLYTTRFARRRPLDDG